MVLRAHICLDAFTILCAPVVNMFPCSIAPYKTNSFDGRVVTNGIHSGYRTMNDIQDARRKTSTLAQFGNDHSRTWIALRRLYNDCVSGGSSQWNRPKWDHGREIKRCNACTHAKWNPSCVSIHIFADFNVIAQKIRSNTNGGLNNLQASMDISLRISQGLPLLQDNTVGQRGCVFSKQSL